MDDISQSIGRLEGKMDLVLQGMTTHFADDKDQFGKLHKKVDSLKTKWAYAAGAVAVVTFLISNFSTITSFLPK
jgi:hypothetical protein